MDLVKVIKNDEQKLLMSRLELDDLLKTSLEIAIIEVCKGFKQELGFPENENMDKVIETIKQWKAKANT